MFALVARMRRLEDFPVSLSTTRFEPLVGFCRKQHIEVIQPSRSSAVILLLAQLDICQKLDAMSAFLICCEGCNRGFSLYSSASHSFAPLGELVPHAP